MRAALEVIDAPDLLTCVVARRVKPFTHFNGALVESLEKLSAEDTALRKISRGRVPPAELAARPGGNLTPQRASAHVGCMAMPLRFIAALLVAGAAASAQSLHDIAVTDIDGKTATLAPFKGRVLLVVNVASECGLTGQYAGLQALHEKYAAKGFAVLGFPCNQFGGQEPGTNAEIKKFCAANYRVTFPMFAKIDVNGANRHPLFARLAGKDSPAPGNVRWNFEKFLVGRDGRLLRRFDAGTEPDDPAIGAAIEAALGAAR